MPLRLLKAWLILAVPLFVSWPCPAADDSPPACTSQSQGRMWPDAANYDHKLIARLARCGELLICVRGTWRYHWEAPSIRVDQLARHAKARASKPSVCEVQSADAPPPDPSALRGN